MHHFTLQPATPDQAPQIAELIMLAMSHECCLHFAGPHHTLDDFRQMMTRLVLMPHSQYSYRHTLVALARRRRVAGICVGYDGGELRRLRQAFVDAARQDLGRDFGQMADETQAGEYYIDSLAVYEEYRGQGMARALLHEQIRRHAATQPVGLLVDCANPGAERLYRHVGFCHVSDATWGGHPMRHLQFPQTCGWALHDSLSLHYHDTRWGRPVHDERLHYKYLLMEAMSCGLSWQMMLQREQVFDRCFDHFDAHRVAAYGDADVERILHTEGMIRSRRKIEGMIRNARAFVEVARQYGSFDRYIWAFTGGRSLIYPAHHRQWVTRNSLSDRVAADLKRRGFCYVGSTIVYSHLQAIGIINDHHPGCHCYAQLAQHCEVVDET